MIKLGLFKTKYLLISLKGMQYLDIYVEPESLYAEKLIYDGVTPAYIFSFLTSECGESIPEIEMYIKKYKLDAFEFIKNIIKENSDLTIKPSTNGILIYWKMTKEIKTFDLELLNIDKYWNLLTPKQIKKKVSKSKSLFPNL